MPTWSRIARSPARAIARFFLTSALLIAAAGSAQAQRFPLERDNDDAWLDRCERDGDRDDRVTVCEVRVSGFRPSRSGFRFDPGANGGVKLEGWDRDSVAVHARVRASAENAGDARALLRGLAVGRSGNTVSADAPETGRRESVSVELVVYLPRRSDVTTETVNGPISARNLYGTLDLQTSNGPLSIENLGGDVQVRTVNGPLSVRLTGTRWEGAGLNAETANGPATLWVPEGYSAELETGTRNGPFDADFPLTINLTGRMQRHFNTTLGRGGTPIRVVTSNGPLSLRRSD